MAERQDRAEGAREGGLMGDEDRGRAGQQEEVGQEEDGQEEDGQVAQSSSFLQLPEGPRFRALRALSRTRAEPRGSRADHGSVGYAAMPKTTPEPARSRKRWSRRRSSRVSRPWRCDIWQIKVGCATTAGAPTSAIKVIRPTRSSSSSPGAWRSDRSPSRATVSSTQRSTLPSSSASWGCSPKATGPRAS